jgi:DNA-binding transcriptional ArsR family regulator
MNINDLEANLFKILSHPIRIEILNILKNTGRYVCDITKLIKETQPQISRNLTVLRQAGLVESEKKGTRICYRVKDKNIFKLLDIAKSILRRQYEEVSSLL